MKLDKMQADTLIGGLSNYYDKYGTLKKEEMVSFFEMFRDDSIVCVPVPATEFEDFCQKSVDDFVESLEKE